MPSWMNMVCCETCNSIFNICAQFNLQNIDKDTAKNELTALDVKPEKFARDSVTETVKKIFATDKPMPSEKKAST